jgi:predicted regulator of Ras-like GTPase activity (Roadblock/LC7/MglB family)
VLEQFSTFRVRSDQLHDPDIPQMETPILKVTLEDSERFGTPAKTVAPPKPVTDAKVEFPAVTSVASPLATPPASSPTASDPVASGAVPASVVPKPATPAIPELKTVKPIRLSVPSQETPAAASSTQLAPSITSSAAPAPRPVIKAKFSPNGIGGPASERVPASSGPPVPTPLPSPFAPLPPTRIAFKVAPPSDDLRSPLAPTSEIAPLTPAVAAPKLPELTPNGPRLQLPLRVVLQGIAPVQISGPRGEVPESAQIDVPFSIVEPQLSLGRISLSPAQFAAALPAEFRDRFKIEDPHTPIPLPLHEVLQHLPNDTLRVRTDQEAPEIAPAFDTPFSQKAAEDAARFESSKPRENLRQEASDPAKDLAASETPKPKTISADVVAKPAAPAPATKPISAKPAVKLIPEKTLLPGTSVAAKEPGNAGATTQAAVRTSLQAIFETDETLEPKAIVSQICLFPGVRACAIMFSDGLCLAHNYPPEFTVDTLCAIAPTVVQKIATQISAAHLGALTSLTLFCAKESVSFFAREAICLAALHTGAEEMAVETRARLSATVEELARLYGTQPHTGQPNA